MKNLFSIFFISSLTFANLSLAMNPYYNSYNNPHDQHHQQNQYNNSNPFAQGYNNTPSNFVSNQYPSHQPNFYQYSPQGHTQQPTVSLEEFYWLQQQVQRLSFQLREAEGMNNDLRHHLHQEELENQRLRNILISYQNSYPTNIHKTKTTYPAKQFSDTSKGEDSAFAEINIPSKYLLNLESNSDFIKMMKKLLSFKPFHLLVNGSYKLAVCEAVSFRELDENAVAYVLSLPEDGSIEDIVVEKIYIHSKKGLNDWQTVAEKLGISIDKLPDALGVMFLMVDSAYDRSQRITKKRLYYGRERGDKEWLELISSYLAEVYHLLAPVPVVVFDKIKELFNAIESSEFSRDFPGPNGETKKITAILLRPSSTDFRQLTLMVQYAGNEKTNHYRYDSLEKIAERLGTSQDKLIEILMEALAYGSYTK